MSADFPPPMSTAHDVIAHKRIDRLETDIGGVYSRINELERKVSGMVTDITWVRGSLDTQREDLEDIKRMTSEHKQQFSKHSHTVEIQSNLTKVIALLATVIAGMLGINLM